MKKRSRCARKSRACCQPRHQRSSQRTKRISEHANLNTYNILSNSVERFVFAVVSIIVGSKNIAQQRTDSLRFRSKNPERNHLLTLPNVQSPSLREAVPVLDCKRAGLAARNACCSSGAGQLAFPKLHRRLRRGADAVARLRLRCVYVLLLVENLPQTGMFVGFVECLKCF